MKNLLRICSSVFLIFILSAKGYADEHFPFTAQVSKQSVNIRAGANTNFEILDKLNQGDEVVVLSKSFDWYKVQLPRTAKSYIRADYLKILQNSTAQLIGDKVHIRALPNSDSASLGMLPQGAVLKVIAQINGWWKIEPPPQAVGWIRQDFLSVKSFTVKPSLVREPIKLQDNSSQKSDHLLPSMVKIEGKLVSLVIPKGDIRYELWVDGKATYYIQNTVDIDQFKGAVVLVDGTVESKGVREHPLLHVVNISLLL